MPTFRDCQVHAKPIEKKDPMPETSVLYKILVRMYRANRTLPEFPEKLGKWHLVRTETPLSAVYADKWGKEASTFVTHKDIQYYFDRFTFQEPEDKTWENEACRAIRKIEYEREKVLQRKARMQPMDEYDVDMSYMEGCLYREL